MQLLAATQKRLQETAGVNIKTAREIIAEHFRKVGFTVGKISSNSGIVSHITVQISYKGFSTTVWFSLYYGDGTSSLSVNLNQLIGDSEEFIFGSDGAKYRINLTEDNTGQLLDALFYESNRNMQMLTTIQSKLKTAIENIEAQIQR